MKSSDIRVTKVHKDCPFTREEICHLKAMLYNVNTSNHCMNPAPISWAVGFQQYEQIEALKGHRERYREYLLNELNKLDTQETL